eukprot:symbB.v1.2.027837.t2/scaffold2770.1/size71041/3
MHQGQELDAISFTGVISACEKSSCWYRALALWEEVKVDESIGKDSVLCGATVSACARAGQWQRAMQLLKEVEDLKLQLDLIIYNSTVTACEKSTPTQWQHALALLVDAHTWNLQADVITCNAAISACEKCGQWQIAMLLLEQAIDVDVISFNSAISACEKASVWQQAMLSFQELLSKGLRPSHVTFAALLSCAEKSQLWRLAQQLLQMAEETQVKLNTVAYNAAISACEKCQHWKWALMLMEEMDVVRIRKDAITFNSAISACEKCAQWQQALHLLSQALSPQTSKTPVDVVSFNAAISACEKGHQWTFALDLLMTLEDQQLTADVVSYTAAIGACEKSAEWMMALSLLEHMQEKRLQPNVVTYNSTISACEKAVEWQKALLLLAEVEKMPHLEATVISYSGAISACEKAAQWPEALHQLGRIEHQRLGANVVTYNAAMSACRRTWSMAVELMDEMGSRKLQKDVVSYTAVISAFETSNLWQFAWHLLEPLEFTINSAPYNAAMSAMAFEQWHRALHLLQMLVERSMASTISFNAAMDACGKAGKWQMAMQLLQTLEMDPLLKPSVISFNTALSALAESATTTVKREDSRWLISLRCFEDLEQQQMATDVSYHQLLASLPPWKVALQLFQEMEAKSIPRSGTSYEVLTLVLSQASWELALHLLSEGPASQFLSPVMLKYVIGACERASAWRHSASLLFQLVAHGFSSAGEMRPPSLVTRNTSTPDLKESDDPNSTSGLTAWFNRQHEEVEVPTGDERIDVDLDAGMEEDAMRFFELPVESTGGRRRRLLAQFCDNTNKLDAWLRRLDQQTPVLPGEPSDLSEPRSSGRRPPERKWPRQMLIRGSIRNGYGIRKPPSNAGLSEEFHLSREEHEMMLHWESQWQAQELEHQREAAGAWCRTPSFGAEASPSSQQEDEFAAEVRAICGDPSLEFAAPPPQAKHRVTLPNCQFVPPEEEEASLHAMSREERLMRFCPEVVNPAFSEELRFWLEATTTTTTTTTTATTATTTTTTLF